MTRVLLCTALIPFLTLLSRPLSAAPDFDPLSLKWAQYIRKHPTHGGMSRQTALKKFRRYHREAYRLYKQRRDDEAVERYERALQFHADGKIYYDYGNSLSNTDRIGDSVKAYLIAIALKYKKIHFAWFNLACVYSKLNKFKQSFEALKEAVRRGYTHLNYIRTDSDLKNLRSGRSWKKQYAAILKIRNKVLYGAATFRTVRWGMIPWRVLKLEKARRVQEGLYRTYYMLWYRTRFMNSTVRLKYLFDKKWYRLQYGAYCFLHLKKKDRGWKGFHYRRGKTDLAKNSSVDSVYEPVYSSVRKMIRKKFGMPSEEEILTRRGSRLSRSIRWRSKDYFITLKAYTTDDGVLDISVYFSNRKRAIGSLL